MTTKQNAPRLQVKGIRKAFGQNVVLKGIDLSVDAGEVVALIGGNGAGKSLSLIHISWVKEAKRIVFFGGAGVSTESGIPDFRGEDGLYRQRYAYPPETIISHSFYLRHPDIFFDFYRHRMLYPNAKPNIVHMKLAQWEKEGRLLAVVTQNIDGLHQMAGSRNVYELHGSVHRNTCQRCGARYTPVSYTHLDVYKRQILRKRWE